jgi:MFS transporter, OFA family, oxalate/formate antiporter
VFVVSGLVFLVVGLPAAAFLRNPPPSPANDSAPAKSTSAGIPPSKLLTRPQFYLLWLQLFVNVLAGIVIISNAVCILADLTNRSAAALAPLFGLVSIFNAAGRFFWGGVSDRIGCERTFAAMFSVQAAALLWLSGVHDLVPALAGISVVLLCCGGGFGTMPSYCARHFGTRYMGLNYGLVLTAWGFAGLIGPMLAAYLRDAHGSFAAMMPVIATLLAGGVIFPCVTRPERAAVRDGAVGRAGMARTRPASGLNSWTTTIPRI